MTAILHFATDWRYGKVISVYIECHGGRGRYLFNRGRTQGIAGIFQAQSEKDNIERKQIYFRGHTDRYAYLKKIGEVQKLF